MVAQKTHPLRLLSRPSTVKLYWHLRSRSLSNYLTADYNPSKTAAGIAGGLYIMASLLLLARLVLARSWWGLCLPISAISTFCFAPPYFLLNNPSSYWHGFLRADCTDVVSQRDRAIRDLTALHHRHTSRISGLQLHTVRKVHRKLC